MPPGPPDRPSLCGVVGKRRTLMLDAGSSTAHARVFVAASRLREVVLGSAAAHVIEGHHESVLSRTDMEDLFEKMRLAERAAHEGLEIEAPDEDIDYFIDAFRAGLTTTP